VRRVDRSPTPPNWEEKLSYLALFGLLVCIGGTVYFLAQTVVSVLRGSTPAALTAGGLAVFSLGFVGAVSFTFLLSARQYAGWSGAGTVVRVHPAIAWSCGIALLGGAVGSSCFLFFVSRGLVNLPFATPGGGRVNRYLMISLLVLSVTGLIALVRSREPGYLRVGADGIEHADMFRTRRARWEDIAEVTDKADKRARNPIVFVVKGDKPVVVPNVDRYGSSGPVLYWMARHYWRHPESRDELTDGRALDRLRNEQFDQS
jgi:hypothetical protein